MTQKRVEMTLNQPTNQPTNIFKILYDTQKIYWLNIFMSESSVQTNK